MSLTRWTGGLVGDRDPAQPLLTLVTPDGRVELSGATTANWVAKNANLLVDGLGAPARVGLLLPLHWQTVCLLLAGVAAGATVQVGKVDGCDAVFTTAGQAPDVDADEVVAVSTHPLGAPGAPPPVPVTDHAREVPSYADHWSGGRPGEVAGHPVAELSPLGLAADDRVLLDVDLAVPGDLRLLLQALHAGAALVLAPTSAELDLAAVARQEGVTAAAGADVPGARRL